MASTTEMRNSNYILWGKRVIKLHGLKIFIVLIQWGLQFLQENACTCRSWLFIRLRSPGRRTAKGNKALRGGTKGWVVTPIQRHHMKHHQKSNARHCKLRAVPLDHRGEGVGWLHRWTEWFKCRSPRVLQNLARSISTMLSISVQLRFQSRHWSNVNMQPKLAWGSEQKAWTRNKATELWLSSQGHSTATNYPGLASCSGDSSGLIFW